MTDDVVVDTNVPIVANGRDTHAGLACRIACIEALQRVQAGRRVVLDDRREIVSEYRRYLSHSGRPGVGDEFFKYVHDNQYSEERVRLVPITKIENADRGYEELPPNCLDRSDRKFLAAAVVARAPVMNAVDSDWREHRALLEDLSVIVEQLCEQP